MWKLKRNKPKPKSDPLPEIVLKYEHVPESMGASMLTIALDYPGVVTGTIGGQTHQSRNGTFTINQRIAYECQSCGAPVTDEQIEAVIKSLETMVTTWHGRVV